MKAERHDLLNKLRIERDSRETVSDQAQSSGRRQWLWLAGIAAVVLVLGLGILIGRIGGGEADSDRAVQPAAKIPAVSTAAVSTTAASTDGIAPAAEPRHVLDASGYVVAQRMATVSSKTTGKMVEIMVEEGMAVEAGQMLARMDSTSEQIEFNLAKSQVAAALAGTHEAQARLREAELSLQRAENLVSRNLVSVAELDGAHATVGSLHAALEMRKAELGVAEQRLALARQRLEDTNIRAPFAGVVTVKNAQPGEIISPVSAGGGFTRTGVCTLVDMQSLEVEVDVNEAYIKRVFPGQRVDARLDAYPDWTIPAKVTTVVPTADRQRATIKVRIGFDELDARILPEMGVKVRFLGE